MEIVYTQLSDPAIQETLRNALGSLYDQHSEAVRYCTLIPQTCLLYTSPSPRD